MLQSLIFRPILNKFGFDRLELVEWSTPILVVDVMSSKGTYIRSLARDLGAALGCGAHLQALRRTAVGAFQIEEATPLTTLEESPGIIMSILLPPEVAVAGWVAVTLDDEQARRVRNGMPIPLVGIAGERARVHGPGGALLALLRRAGDEWKPDKVFDWT